MERMISEITDLDVFTVAERAVDICRCYLKAKARVRVVL